MTLSVARRSFDHQGCVFSDESRHIKFQTSVSVGARICLDGERFRGTDDASDDSRAQRGRSGFLESRNEI
jgi:hypothetical protein